MEEECDETGRDGEEEKAKEKKRKEKKEEGRNKIFPKSRPAGKQR